MTGGEIARLLEPTIERLGYELIDLEAKLGGKGGLVRLYIDKPEGIDLDDCEKVSLAVSALLDVEDLHVEYSVGGGFVVESTWTDGCYEVLSGTSMATPVVAGLAAAHWQGDAASTRAWLVVGAEDVNNASRVPGVDPTSAGWDPFSGYGLARTAAGTDGGGAARVSAWPSEGAYGEAVLLQVSGPAEASFRIGVTSPSGDWTWGEFRTDAAGRAPVELQPWREPGTWLVSVDFGGGRGSFDPAWATYRQR